VTKEEHCHTADGDDAQGNLIETFLSRFFREKHGNGNAYHGCNEQADHGDGCHSLVAVEVLEIVDENGLHKRYPGQVARVHDKKAYIGAVFKDAQERFQKAF